MRRLKGNQADQSGYERKRAKQAERRRPHVDKYATNKVRSDNGEERDHERR